MDQNEISQQLWDVFFFFTDIHGASMAILIFKWNISATIAFTDSGSNICDPLMVNLVISSSEHFHFGTVIPTCLQYFFVLSMLTNRWWTC